MLDQELKPRHETLRRTGVTEGRMKAASEDFSHLLHRGARCSSPFRCKTSSHQKFPGLSPCFALRRLAVSFAPLRSGSSIGRPLRSRALRYRLRGAREGPPCARSDASARWREGEAHLRFGCRADDPPCIPERQVREELRVVRVAIADVQTCLAPGSNDVWIEIDGESLGGSA